MEMSSGDAPGTPERRRVRGLKKKKKSPKKSKKENGITEPITEPKEEVQVQIPNARYYATMQVGTPEQGFRVIYDSGSSDIWLPSKDCTKCGSSAINAKNKLDEDLSGTFERVGTDYSIGDESTSAVIGEYVKDTVTLADTIAVESQTFALIDDFTGMGEAYARTLYDGVFGLGLTATILQNAREQEVVEKEVFAFNLSGDDNGELTFGGYDESKDLTWVDLCK
jgi:hypothetical protein